MKALSEADRFLLERITAGEESAWAEFVDRYQGRLLAFARRRTDHRIDPEDAVQETFLACLRSLAAFRGRSSMETFLFTILRRKIIDQRRGQRLSVCSLQDAMGGAGGGEADPADADWREATASAYARRNEADEHRRDALAAALRQVVERYRAEQDFDDLKTVELLFYCQLRGDQVAAMTGATPQRVRVFKHRCVQRIREAVQAAMPEDPAREADAWRNVDGADRMVREVWEDDRLSCPKRSTIGGYLLQTLDGPWQDYVDFHLHRLGCRYCQANLDDMQREIDEAESTALRKRIMNSTVGFLKSAGQ